LPPGDGPKLRENQADTGCSRHPVSATEHQTWNRTEILSWRRAV